MKIKPGFLIAIILLIVWVIGRFFFGWPCISSILLFVAVVIAAFQLNQILEGDEEF